MVYSTPSEFYAYWTARIERARQIADKDLREIVRYRDSDGAVADVIGALACRGLLNPAQTAKLLKDLPKRFPISDLAYDQVLALVIVRDGLRSPISKLYQLLRMKCDWAAAMVIQDLGPYNCGEAFVAINQSTRPARIKSELCTAVSAHQKSMWAEIDTLHG